MFGIEFLPEHLQRDSILLETMIEGAKHFLQKRVDFVLIPANPRHKASVDSLLSAYLLRECISNMLFVPTLSGSGFTRSAAGERVLESRLLSIFYAHFTHIAIIGGEGDGIDGITLIQKARALLGQDIYIISGTNALKTRQSKQRLVKKLRAGVNHIITQPFFSTQEAETFLREFYTLQKAIGISAKVSLGVFGLFSAQTAMRINAAELGFEVPQTYINAIDCVDSMQNADMIESIESAHIHKQDTQAQARFKQLWKQMDAIAKDYNASLYLSTPKHNDLRAYQKINK